MEFFRGTPLICMGVDCGGTELLVLNNQSKPDHNFTTQVAHSVRTQNQSLRVEQRYVDTPKRRIVSFQFTDFFLHSTFLISHLANFLLYFYLEFIHPILRTKSYQVKAARPGRPCFHFNIVAVPHWQPRLASRCEREPGTTKARKSSPIVSWFSVSDYHYNFLFG